MTDYVFPFYNLTLPGQSDYTNDAHNVRIELLEGAEEFENDRRKTDSDYRTGYWHTANIHIEQSKEDAIRTANHISQILSFALHRDVRFNGYYKGTEQNNPFHTISTRTFDIDNTNLKIVNGVVTGPPNPGIELGPFIDVVLDTVIPASEAEQNRKLKPISQFLEASAANFVSNKFTILWIALESSANRNYESYQEEVGDLFTKEEREQVQSILLENVEDQFRQKQLEFLEYRFGQKYLYEHSIDVKIKIFLEYLDIGFDMDEIEEIIQESREIRNLVVHEGDSERLIDNTNRWTDLRKIVIYVILRNLGVDNEFQERLIMPMIVGPDVS
ncbi:hypothetical protein Halru_0830 [Halovivax ruber XH-70]|uniref:Apea-like HEPN domain-containing protein n=1 Tax=Halovivax ruber (strain DSM 18193 / JCM 13892 / XH-70) TaxID=797302 RepID=L0I7B8_HALRX|nr:HEPN domain-containing protein [Halovivax ruber]AGB15455.1 hypothetical protein Halru_0830 [Halovivax ruber XH-70]